MDLFSQFRRRLINRYIRLTGIIIFMLILLVYGFVGSLVYSNFINQAHLLSTEEAEELSYIVSNGKTLPDFPNENDQMQKYFNKIFYYMYDDNNKLLKTSNRIDWSKDSIDSMIAADALGDGQPEIHMVFTKQNEFRFFVISRESAYYNGRYAGRVYAGFDISGDLMFLGRLLLWIIALLIVAFFVMRKAANSMANRAMQPIIESFEKQVLFAANASHELRTPLSILLSGLDILKDDADNKLSAFSKEIVGDMKAEILKMKALIGNLLLLARSDSSAVALRKRVVPAAEITENIAARFKSIAVSKDIELIELESGQELLVYADCNHVEQILTILLDNAVKYTPKKEKIYIKTEQVNDMTAISVINTGVSISEKDMPHIFDRFYRSINAQKYEGSGLGLSIAKALAEKNSGKLLVNSEENIKTIFTLCLPQK